MLGKTVQGGEGVLHHAGSSFPEHQSQYSDAQDACASPQLSQEGAKGSDCWMWQCQFPEYCSTHLSADLTALEANQRQWSFRGPPKESFHKPPHPVLQFSVDKQGQAVWYVCLFHRGQLLSDSLLPQLGRTEDTVSSVHLRFAGVSI